MIGKSRIELGCTVVLAPKILEERSAEKPNQVVAISDPEGSPADPEESLTKAPSAKELGYPTTAPVCPVILGPNITGYVGEGLAYSRENIQGVFSESRLSENKMISWSYSNPTAYVAYPVFNAMRSNNLYGGSNTVQPMAIRVLPLIKF